MDITAGKIKVGVPRCSRWTSLNRHVPDNRTPGWACINNSGGGGYGVRRLLLELLLVDARSPARRLMRDRPQFTSYSRIGKFYYCVQATFELPIWFHHRYLVAGQVPFDMGMISRHTDPSGLFGVHSAIHRWRSPVSCVTGAGQTNLGMSMAKKVAGARAEWTPHT